MPDDRSHPTPTDDDTGKPVVTTDDTQIGVISAVRGESVYIDPDPNLAEDIHAVLGGDTTDDTYSFDAKALERDPYADIAVFRVDLDSLTQD